MLVRITPAGLALLSRLDPPIQQLHRRQLGHLTRKQLQALTDLLAAATLRTSSSGLRQLFVATNYLPAESNEKEEILTP